MKTIKADLLADVTGTYDQTKTTIQGRVAQRTVDGLPVLGPPLTNFIDFATDTGGLVPTSAIHATNNGRLFICGTVSAGVIPIILYNFNYTTGAFSYVGRINMTTPNTAATTHTIRDLRAIDAGITGWKIYVSTVGSVLINGGTFCLNSIDEADFVPVSSPTIPFATGNNQKAVYFSQNSAAIGVGQLETASVGLVYDSVGAKLYTHNGISATHQYYVRDVTASMTYTATAVSVNVASPGKVTYTSHPFLTNDPVVFTAGTLPTGLVVGTTYFVRNPGVNDFELSATSGGASINTTGSPSVGAFLGRAFGTSSADFLHKTGNLPALSGTLLLTGSEREAIPVDAPLNGGVLNGNSCAFLATSTNLYLGLLSELTSGTTTWPSLTTSNVLAPVNTITAPTPLIATWSNSVDSCIYNTNVSKFIIKKVENNVVTAIFGALSNQYMETNVLDAVRLNLVTINTITSNQGWLFVAGGTVGQRVVVFADLRSSSDYDYSYIVTKVLDTPNSQIQAVSLYSKLATLSGHYQLFYRTSGFGSITGGWTEIDIESDLSSISTASQIQFKIAFKMMDNDESVPIQINELLLTTLSNEEISDHFEYSHDYSSNTSPTRCAFRLKAAYTTSVPTLYFRAYDLSASLLTNHNTSANPSYFEYSTNSGVSWNPLGTIPNTVGTLVRYTFSSPPGVDIRPVIKES